MSTNWDFLPERSIKRGVYATEEALFVLPEAESSDLKHEESGFEGSEGYFAQGGMEMVMPKNKAVPGKFTKWDRTLTVRVRNNSVIPGNIQQAIIFGSKGQPQPGINVQVVIPDSKTSLGASFSQEIVRAEIIGNPFTIKGMRVLVQNRLGATNAEFLQQVFTPLILQNNTITGSLEQYNYQIQNGVSPTIINRQQANFWVFDFPDFKVDPQRDFQISYDIVSRVDVFFVFTLAARVENSNVMFDRNTVSVCDDYRNIGNPLADIAIENSAKKALEDCNYTSAVQYAFSPRPTGNTLADIVILND
jgi:hypothetical protein